MSEEIKYINTDHHVFYKGYLGIYYKEANRHTIIVCQGPLIEADSKEDVEKYFELYVDQKLRSSASVLGQVQEPEKEKA